MKKRRNLKEIDNVPRANPVAKHAFQFNKAHVIADKKQYRRKAKHGKQEAFVNIDAHVFTKVSWLFDFSFPRAALVVIHKCRHTRREAGIQCQGWQAQIVPESWIPAIPAGMTEDVYNDERAAWECGFGALRHEARNSPQRG